MKELQQLLHLQAERLNLLMLEQGITTQKELAEVLEVSPTSVNLWINSKVRMNNSSAELICSKFPDYSAEYLLGYSEYRNSEAEEKTQSASAAGRNYRKIDCVQMLATITNGTEIQSMSLGDNPEQISLKHDGKSLTPSFWDWSEFADEVCDYIEMRINRKVERGRW